jgi:hypothetical protein
MRCVLVICECDMDQVPNNRELQPSRKKRRDHQILLSALVGGAIGVLLASFVTWAPDGYVLGTATANSLAGIAMFAAIGAAFGVVIELILTTSEPFWPSKL